MDKEERLNYEVPSCMHRCLSHGRMSREFSEERAAWGRMGNEVKSVDRGKARVAMVSLRSITIKEAGLRVWACAESAARTEGGMFAEFMPSFCPL